MARPLLPIDGDQVRRLAKLGLSQADIAEFFDCAQSVISERFRSDYDVGVSESKISVRRMMWKRARQGADTILLRLDDRYFGKGVVDDGKGDSGLIEEAEQRAREHDRRAIEVSERPESVQ